MLQSINRKIEKAKNIKFENLGSAGKENLKRRKLKKISHKKKINNVKNCNFLS